jgi:hypothetical protein
MRYGVVTYTVMDYDEEGINRFVELVNRILEEGWKLQGGVSCFPIPECKDCIFFAQAITQLEGNDER